MNFNAHSIQLKVSASFGIILMTLVIAVLGAIYISLASRLEAQQENLIQSSGKTLVSELQRRTDLGQTLALSIAKYMENPLDHGANHKLAIAQIMDVEEGNHLIAGGGYWPEPYQYKKDKQRASIFFGRDKSGSLISYNDYNDPNGAGYHHEEWYVPSAHAKKGDCYWSRTYVDPFSKEPMVTCTVGIFRNKSYVGSSTIDLRLTGLQQFFEEQSKALGGYVFAVDQHNGFITYPSHEKISLYSNDRNEHTRLNAQEFSDTNNLFKPFFKHLQDINNKVIEKAQHSSEYNHSLNEIIDNNSYQINAEEAKLVSAALHKPFESLKNNSLLLETFEIDKDIVLNKPVRVSIFHIPDTYWKLLIVTPKDKTHKIIIQTFLSTAIFVVPIILLILSFAFFMLKRSVVNPINSITYLIKKNYENKDNLELIEENRSDEIGQLVHWYNERTKQLTESVSQLSSINKKLKHQASHDSLTSLLNRREFDEQFSLSLENEDHSKITLLYIDIDQFKIINDTCGHAAGDHLLIKIGNTIRRLVRSKDHIARLGGDEFALLVNTDNSEQAQKFALRLCEKIREIYFIWDSRHFDVSCSIGVVRIADSSADKSIAMQYADSACYAAKEAGRDRIHLYMPDDIVVSKRHGEMSWISKINEALEKDQFYLEFQPIEHINNPTQEKFAMEALIRLRSQNGKSIPPGAFLPAAERYNKSLQIDKWVIDKTLSLLNTYNDKLSYLEWCSINLAADSLSDPQLPSFIQDRIDYYNIEPSKLCFEITENNTISNIDAAKSLLKELQKIGCLIALDDFGSGMSSYTYLRSFPVDIVKIDGSFVININTNKTDYAIVRSITDIAKSMELKIIAEYVENDAIVEKLKGIDIDYGQGWGISKPCEIEKILDYGNNRKTL